MFSMKFQLNFDLRSDERVWAGRHPKLTHPKSRRVLASPIYLLRSSAVRCAIGYSLLTPIGHSLTGNDVRAIDHPVCIECPVFACHKEKRRHKKIMP